MGKGSTYSTIEGVVLAGGLNSRFYGKIKANIVVEKRPIIENTLTLFDTIFDRVSIVANDADAFSKYLNYPIVSDIFKKIGPLGGIHSALNNSEAEAVFIVAADMPLLSEKIIRFMLKDFQRSSCEVLIPRLGKFREPLHAIYSSKILSRLEEFLLSGGSYAIKDFLMQTDVKYIEIDEQDFDINAFSNINTPEDLERIRAGLRT